MPMSTPKLPSDRLAIGQLLVRLLHHFRTELFAAGQVEQRFPGIRFSHLQIWGNLGTDGIRLTALADHANLSLAACSELVNDLERLGYLERRPDPSDGRAKLIHPTTEGRALLDEAGREVAQLEARWRTHLPNDDFDLACRTLDTLLRSLDHQPSSSRHDT